MRLLDLATPPLPRPPYHTGCYRHPGPPAPLERKLHRHYFATEYGVTGKSINRQINC